MEFVRADLPEDLSAQALAFDAVLPPAGTPDVLVRDDTGAYWLQIAAPNAARLQLQVEPDTFDFQKDADGIWRLKLPLTGGLHNVHLLVDGTLWLSPYLPIAYG